MADKRISQLVERTDIANNDVVPIVASGATTTNKATISSIQTFMQENLDVGVTSVGITLGTTGTDVSVSGSPVTTSGNITINLPTASATNRGLLSAADWVTFNNKANAADYVTLGTVQTITAQKTFTTSGSSDTMIISHGSGSGFALDVLKAGSGEAIRVTKTSGSGNAMTISGGNFEAPAIVKTGGTSAQFLKADGSVDSNGYVSTTATENISGTKTFLNSIFANAGIRLDQNGTALPTFIQNISGNGLITSGANGIGFNATNDLYFSGSGKGGAVLTVNNSAVRNYTLPDANGIIALTSDISTALTGYVTLATSQTISGAKNFTSAININSNGSIASNATYGTQITRGTGSFADWGVVNSGGTGVIWNPTGTPNISVAGTILAVAATISGSVTAGVGTFINSSAGASRTGLVVRNSGSTVVGTESRLFLSTVGGDDRGAYISSIITSSSNDNDLILATNSAGAAPTEKLRISSTGAATFSSNVIVGGGTTSTSKLTILATTGVAAPGSPTLGIYDTSAPTFGFDFSLEGVASGDLFLNRVVSGTRTAVLQIARATGAATFSSSVTTTSATINSGAGNNFINFIQNSTNIGFVGDANWIFGGSISDFGIRATNNLVFGIGASEKMRITSGGNVGIGTDSPSDKLIVNGNLGITDGSFASGESYSLYLGDKNAFMNSTFGQKVKFGAFNGFDFGFGENGNLTLSSTWMSITSGGAVQVGAATNGRLGVRGFTNDSSAYAFEAANSSGSTLFITRNDGVSSFFGSVGIGTASVGRKLQINVTPVSGEDDGINIYNGTTNFLLTRTSSTYTYRGVAPLSGMIYSENNISLLSDGGNITFHNSGSERMRITSGGNVEISTGSIKTGNPSGSSAQPFRVGSVTTSSNSFFGTVVKMEINGTVYDVMIATPPL